MENGENRQNSPLFGAGTILQIIEKYAFLSFTLSASSIFLVELEIKLGKRYNYS